MSTWNVQTGLSFLQHIHVHVRSKAFKIRTWHWKFSTVAVVWLKLHVCHVKHCSEFFMQNTHISNIMNMLESYHKTWTYSAYWWTEFCRANTNLDLYLVYKASNLDDPNTGHHQTICQQHSVTLHTMCSTLKMFQSYCISWCCLSREFHVICFLIDYGKPQLSDCKTTGRKIN